MKLILTQQVAGLGAPGDVVEVKDGYGRNYLEPRGFAIQWTRGAEKQITSIKKARSAREIADLDHAKEIAGRLEALRVTLSTQAGANGRLFGSVTNSDIAEALGTMPEVARAIVTGSVRRRREIIRDSMGTPSSMPSRWRRVETHSLAKIRMRSSSRER